MFYSRGGGSGVSSRNSVGYNLHQKKIGGGVTVGGAAANIRGMHKVYGL